MAARTALIGLAQRYGDHPCVTMSIAPRMKPTPPAAQPLIVSRLSVMMFLQYAALGLWAVTVGTYIDRNTGEAGAGIFSAGFIGLSATAGALGAMVSPVLLGIVADRYVATERLLCALHAVCAGCLWVMSVADHQGVFFAALVLYNQCYAPSATLTSSLSLRQLPDAEKQFAVVRAIGTLGWVAAGVLIGYLWPVAFGRSIEPTVIPLRIAAVAQLVLAAYCLSLPHTPALGTASVGWRALTGGATIWGNRPFLIFLAISALAAAPTQFYNSFVNPFLNNIGVEHAAAKLSLGQVGEVGFLLALPLMMLRFRLKTLFLVGALAWAARFVLLAVCDEGSRWIAYPAILVHGACFTFVYMTGQLYADRLADRDARGAAQGLHMIVTYGIGHLTGALAGRFAQATYLTPEGVTPPPYEWTTFWLIAASMSLAAAILFALFFNDRPQPSAGGATTTTCGRACGS